MNLTRGEGGNFPCPICYVPHHEQAQLTNVYELRTMRETQEIIKQASDPARTKANAEELLKSKGLRLLEVFLAIFILQ